MLGWWLIRRGFMPSRSVALEHLPSNLGSVAERSFDRGGQQASWQQLCRSALTHAFAFHQCYYYLLQPRFFSCFLPFALKLLLTLGGICGPTSRSRTTLAGW